MNNIDININNKLGGTSQNTKKVSTKGTKTALNQTKKTNSNGLGIAKKTASELSKGISSINSGSSATNIVGVLSKGGVAMKVIGKVVQVASKGVDLYLNYAEAKTGESMYYSNIRTAKSLIMSVGLDYAYGAIRNEMITKQIVKRQNAALEYGQQLYNLNNYGQKNKIR